MSQKEGPPYHETLEGMPVPGDPLPAVVDGTADPVDPLHATHVTAGGGAQVDFVPCGFSPGTVARYREMARRLPDGIVQIDRDGAYWFRQRPVPTGPRTMAVVAVLPHVEDGRAIEALGLTLALRMEDETEWLRGRQWERHLFEDHAILWMEGASPVCGGDDGSDMTPVQLRACVWLADLLPGGLLTVGLANITWHDRAMHEITLPHPTSLEIAAAGGPACMGRELHARMQDMLAQATKAVKTTWSTNTEGELCEPPEWADVDWHSMMTELAAALPGGAVQLWMVSCELRWSFEGQEVKINSMTPADVRTVGEVMAGRTMAEWLKDARKRAMADGFSPDVVVEDEEIKTNIDQDGEPMRDEARDEGVFRDRSGEFEEMLRDMMVQGLFAGARVYARLAADPTKYPRAVWCEVVSGLATGMAASALHIMGMRPPHENIYDLWGTCDVPGE